MENNNPFDRNLFAPFGSLGVAAPPKNSLYDLILPPEQSPLGNALTRALLGDAPAPRSRSPFSLGDLVNPSSLGVPSGVAGYPRPSAEPEGLFSLGELLAPPSSPFGSLARLGAAIPPSPTPTTKNLLASLIAPPVVAPPKPTSIAPTIKRRTFFSFHYADIMRVNAVRKAWSIKHPDSTLMRSFIDGSLWEKRKLEGEESLKRLIRDGVKFSSTVCVLVGSETWLRPWVRYEVARAIIDGRGLLAVHLNSIKHHKGLTAHALGYNPLEFMAVGKVQQYPWLEAKYFLFEKVALPNGRGGFEFGWVRYSKHTNSVSLPRWLRDPKPGYVTPLAGGCAEYDFKLGEGHKNIGGWIDQAAQRAGR